MGDVALIDIRNATIYRGNTRVFDRLTLRIEQHVPTAILGPNGCGKTTLLKVINREIYPVHADDSRVSILGRDNWNVWELRKRIGILSHDLQAAYRPNTNGIDVVLSGYLSSIGIHGILAGKVSQRQIDRARQVMAELGVARLAATPLGSMSTGQQRRCLLARALVHDPDTLILDEPTAGLDLAASFDYLARIRRLASAGKNIVLVSHSLNEIPPDVQRVILLRDGAIVADGDKREILTETNLQQTFATRMRIAEVDGYFLAYPPVGTAGQ